MKENEIKIENGYLRINVFEDGKEKRLIVSAEILYKLLVEIIEKSK